jgi:hypothetical protein
MATKVINILNKKTVTVTGWRPLKILYYTGIKMIILLDFKLSQVG